jgi:tetrapyrrole methylase family protein/MazG family protein
LEKSLVSLPAGFEGLIALVEVLRSEHGCPWDREQTAEQIKTYLLEEAYEVLEALDSGSHGDVCAELGDLLFHILFLARVFEEAGDFNIEDVVDTITTKMIRRHPHVFGQAQVSDSDEVRHRWHEIKMAETKDKDTAQGASLESVPQNLPALMRAYRVSERAARLGFEWPDMERVLQKLDHTLTELKVSIKKADSEKSAEDLGDLLFALVNLGRSMQVHPEEALRRTIMKFIKRVEAIAQTLTKQGRTLGSASAEEIEKIWEACQGK